MKVSLNIHIYIQNTVRIHTIQKAYKITIFLPAKMAEMSCLHSHC